MEVFFMISQKFFVIVLLIIISSVGTFAQSRQPGGTRLGLATLVSPSDQTQDVALTSEQARRVEEVVVQGSKSVFRAFLRDTRNRVRILRDGAKNIGEKLSNIGKKIGAHIVHPSPSLVINPPSGVDVKENAAEINMLSPLIRPFRNNRGGRGEGTLHPSIQASWRELTVIRGNNDRQESQVQQVGQQLEEAETIFTAALRRMAQLSSQVARQKMDELITALVSEGVLPIHLLQLFDTIKGDFRLNRIEAEMLSDRIMEVVNIFRIERSLHYRENAVVDQVCQQIASCPLSNNPAVNDSPVDSLIRDFDAISNSTNNGTLMIPR